MLLALAGALLSSATTIAAEDEAVEWLTGAKFRAKLAADIGVAWENISLRRAITSLAKSEQIAILLDRRVNPDETIELTLKNVSLETLLKSIAEQRKMGVGIVGSTVYIGPPEIASKIRTLALVKRNDASHAGAGLTNKLLATRPLAWDDATAPREILEGLAKESGVAIAGLDKIPHDLWASASIPPCTLVERLTLVMAQFDLTFDVGSQLRLVEIPQKLSVEQKYTLSATQRPQAEQLVANLKKLSPAAEVHVSGSSLTVHGRAEDQDLVETLLSGKQATTTAVTGGKKVYQLSIVMPVGKLIQSLGKKMDLEVTIDEPAINAAGLSLTKEVKVDVKNVDQDGLLSAVLSPAGLSYERRGDTITVKPAK